MPLSDTKIILYIFKLYFTLYILYSQLDCSPAYNPDQSYQVRLEAAMSTTALPNFINIIRTV